VLNGLGRGVPDPEAPVLVPVCLAPVYPVLAPVCPAPVCPVLAPVYLVLSALSFLLSKDDLTPGASQRTALAGFHPGEDGSEVVQTQHPCPCSAGRRRPNRTVPATEAQSGQRIGHNPTSARLREVKSPA